MNVTKSIDVILSTEGKVLGGQQAASLSRTAKQIDITNKINSDWQEQLSGMKSWSINCSGSYLVNSESLELLESAFINNKTIDVLIKIGNKNYKGQAIITNFPLNSSFSQGLKYSISLLGTGALTDGD